MLVPAASLGEAFGFFLLLLPIFLLNQVDAGVSNTIMFFVNHRAIFMCIGFVTALTTVFNLSKGRKRDKLFAMCSIVFPAAMICATCIGPKFLYLRGAELAGPVWGIYFSFPLLIAILATLHFLLPKGKHIITVVSALGLNTLILFTIGRSQLIALADYFTFRVPF